MSPLAFALRGLIRQPGRAMLGIAGIAATGALLFDMLMLSQGLVLSMERLLADIGFDIRVSATQAAPLTGPPIANVSETVTALAALPGIADVVPLRIGEARIDLGDRSRDITFMGANAPARKPWTLLRGRDIDPRSDRDQPGLLINENLARRLDLTPGSTITLRGACTANSSVPPTTFRVEGIVEFPFDQASQLTTVTT